MTLDYTTASLYMRIATLVGKHGKVEVQRGQRLKKKEYSFEEGIDKLSGVMIGYPDRRVKVRLNERLWDYTITPSFDTSGKVLGYRLGIKFEKSGEELKEGLVRQVAQSEAYAFVMNASKFYGIR